MGKKQKSQKKETLEDELKKVDGQDIQIVANVFALMLSVAVGFSFPFGFAYYLHQLIIGTYPYLTRFEVAGLLIMPTFAQGAFLSLVMFAVLRIYGFMYADIRERISTKDALFDYFDE